MSVGASSYSLDLERLGAAYHASELTPSVVVDNALAAIEASRKDGLPFGITFISPAFGESALAQWGSRFHRAAAQRLGATAFSLPDARGGVADV